MDDRQGETPKGDEEPLMPLTSKGKKTLASMEKTYDSKKKATQVFYASINKGTLKGAERTEQSKRKARRA